MTSLRYITAEDSLALSESCKKAGPMKIYQVVGGPYHIRLSNAKVVFEPSVYGGTGAEVRLGMVLRLSDDQLDSLRQVEEGRQKQTNTRWQSAIKESDGQYEAAFRPKINKERVQIFTEYSEASSWPSMWRGRTINAIVRLGGVYVQSQSCGPLWEVTHAQVQPEAEENPFA